MGIQPLVNFYWNSPYELYKAIYGELWFVGFFHVYVFFITEPALIAKSSLLLDVKPWDDETDMVALEKCVRSIEADGLLWGACKGFSFMCD